MFCPSCGHEYRDGFTECLECEVPLVAEAPKAARRHRPTFARFFPRSPARRPFLLTLIGVGMLLGGGWTLMWSLVSVVLEPMFGVSLRGIPNHSSMAWTGLAGLASMAVGVAIVTDRPWSRPLLMGSAFVALVINQWGAVLKGAERTALQLLMEPGLALAFTAWLPILLAECHGLLSGTANRGPRPSRRGRHGGRGRTAGRRASVR